VTLPPLDSFEVAALVGSMLGANDVTPELAQALTDATRGNALLVSEVLRTWVKDGRLRPHPSGWMFRVAPRTSEIAREVGGLFRERLRELAPVHFQALCVLAIARRPLALGLLSAVLEADPDTASLAVAELRRRNLVFLSRGEFVQVATERWSDAANALMNPKLRKTLHLRLAEELTSGDPALAALHYQRGMNLAAAAEQYGRAAQQCYERGALNEVLEHTERSAACGASAEALGRLWSLAAEAARLIGDSRAVSFAERALMLLPVGGSDWIRASRVAIAMFNPLAKGS
jgi:predicted ATPase